MAAHESPRTTKLYDCTKERLIQDEVERSRLRSATPHNARPPKPLRLRGQRVTGSQDTSQFLAQVIPLRPLLTGYSMLQPGLYSIPSGMIATIVTSLEMLQVTALRPEIAEPTWNFEKLNPNPAEYRHLYGAVGEDWLWVTRLLLNDNELSVIMESPDIEVYKLTSETGGVGMLELDFRQDNECELTFFGLSRALIGGPAGRWLMNRAIERAWSRPIKRFWFHTCTLDHPSALDFYKRSGFQQFRFEVEVLEDPRLSGRTRTDAAPHIPLLS